MFETVPSALRQAAAAILGASLTTVKPSRLYPSASDEPSGVRNSDTPIALLEIVLAPSADVPAGSVTLFNPIITTEPSGFTYV